MKVKVISLPYIFQVLYALCFTRPIYQVSVYRTNVPLVYRSHGQVGLILNTIAWIYIMIDFGYTDDEGKIALLLYWAKVLLEQWKLLQIFRTHEIFRKFLKMHFDQAIIHILKSLNFIFIKCLQITSFFNVLEVPTQNVRLQN